MHRRSIFAAIAAVTLTGAAVARAGIAPSARITTCVNSAGTLRFIDAGKTKTCRKGERMLSWNQIGPQGPAGPQGPQGRPGFSAAVPQVSVYRRDETHPARPGNDNYQPNCDLGDQVTGGGFGDLNLTGDVIVTLSRPSSAGEAWSVMTHNPTSAAIPFAAYVICLDK